MRPCERVWMTVLGEGCHLDRLTQVALEDRSRAHLDFPVPPPHSCLVF